MIIYQFVIKLMVTSSGWTSLWVPGNLQDPDTKDVYEKLSVTSTGTDPKPEIPPRSAEPIAACPDVSMSSVGADESVHIMPRGFCLDSAPVSNKLCAY